MVELTVSVLLLALGLVVGKTVEHLHHEDLRKRERRYRKLPALSTSRVPAHWSVEDAVLLTGSVVISIDYWKRFAAQWKKIVGGSIRSYETLFERARREAILRLKEAAGARGCDAVIGVRLESAEIADLRGDKGTGGVELIAVGTALRTRR